MTAAQDPNELFDVVDARGQPTGIQKLRSEVHRDGDWHRCVHVWLVGGTGHDGWIVFQQRGPDKDTFPNMLDATVGGHLGSGETVWDGLREVEEEIGLSLASGEVERVGFRRAAFDGDDVHDYEIQEIFFARVDDPLTCCTPNPDELAGLVQTRISDVLPVLVGQESWCWGEWLTCEGIRERRKITRDILVPVADEYYARVALAAQDFLAGRDFVRV
jgi:isopentenyldiphosphate isomerase